MSNEISAEAWNQAASAASITVEELDAMVQNYKNKRDEYEAAKKVSTGHYHELEKAEKALQEALKAMGKKSYKCEGVGTFTRVMKEVVTVPKEIEAKRKLLGWIKDQYGPDVLDTMVSINHQSLNSFYREEAKKSDNPAFEIPGIAAPTAVENVSFRRG